MIATVPAHHGTRAFMGAQCLSTIDRGTKTLRFLLSRLLQLVRTWRDRRAKRDQLATFNERQLYDIGITQVDALRETRKPFWRA